MWIWDCVGTDGGSETESGEKTEDEDLKNIFSAMVS